MDMPGYALTLSLGGMLVALLAWMVLTDMSDASIPLRTIPMCMALTIFNLAGGIAVGHEYPYWIGMITGSASLVIGIIAVVLCLRSSSRFKDLS